MSPSKEIQFNVEITLCQPFIGFMLSFPYLQSLLIEVTTFSTDSLGN